MRDGSKVKLDTLINTKELELDKEPTKVLDIGEIDRFGHFDKNSNFDLSHTGYEKQIIRLVGELKRYRLNKEEQGYLNQLETYANILTKNCSDIYEYFLKDMNMINFMTKYTLSAQQCQYTPDFVTFYEDWMSLEKPTPQAFQVLTWYRILKQALENILKDKEITSGKLLSAAFGKFFNQDNNQCYIHFEDYRLVEDEIIKANKDQKEALKKLAVLFEPGQEIPLDPHDFVNIKFEPFFYGSNIIITYKPSGSVKVERKINLNTMKPENYAYVTYEKNGRKIKKKIPLSENEYAVSNEHNLKNEMVVYKRKENGSPLEKEDGEKRDVISAPGRILRDDDRDRMTVS